MIPVHVRDPHADDPPAGTEKSGAARYSRTFGFALLAGGLIVNKWTIEWTLVPDGRVEAVLLLYLIAAFQLLAIASGWRALTAPPAALIRIGIVWTTLAVLTLWALLAAGSVGYARFRVFGLYEPESFLIAAASTYLGAMLCYVLWRPPLWIARGTNALLNVGVIALLVVVVETPAMLGWTDYRAFLSPTTIGGMGPRNRVYKESYFHRPPYDEFTEVRPGSGAVLAGLVDAPLYRSEHIYDRNGFRNREEHDRVHVLLVGDSFVEGFRVTQDSIISEALADHVPGPIYNLGQSGFGPTDQLAALRHVGLALRPDVVAWFFFEGNDLFDFDTYRRNGAGGMKDRSFTLNMIRNLAYFGPKVAVAPETAVPAAILKPEVPAIHREYLFELSGPFVPTERSLQYLADFQAVASEARALVQEAGGQFVMVFVPMKARVYKDLGDLPAGLRTQLDVSDIRDRLEAWVSEEGIDYLDLTDSMTEAARSGDQVYYPDDAHWTAAGHDHAARQLATFLERSHWLGDTRQASTGR